MTKKNNTIKEEIFTQDDIEFYIITNLDEGSLKTKQFYCLTLYPTHLSYLESSNTTQNIYDFVFDQSQWVFNGEIMRGDPLETLVPKFNRLTTELKSNKAYVLEKRVGDDTKVVKDDAETREKLDAVLSEINKQNLNIQVISQEELDQITGGTGVNAVGPALRIVVQNNKADGPSSSVKFFKDNNPIDGLNVNNIRRNNEPGRHRNIIEFLSDKLGFSKRAVRQELANGNVDAAFIRALEGRPNVRVTGDGEGKKVGQVRIMNDGSISLGKQPLSASQIVALLSNGRIDLDYIAKNDSLGILNSLIENKKADLVGMPLDAVEHADGRNSREASPREPHRQDSTNDLHRKDSTINKERLRGLFDHKTKAHGNAILNGVADYMKLDDAKVAFSEEGVYKPADINELAALRALTGSEGKNFLDYNNFNDLSDQLLANVDVTNSKQNKLANEILGKALKQHKKHYFKQVKEDLKSRHNKSDSPIEKRIFKDMAKELSLFSDSKTFKTQVLASFGEELDTAGWGTIEKNVVLSDSNNEEITLKSTITPANESLHEALDLDSHTTDTTFRDYNLTGVSSLSQASPRAANLHKTSIETADGESLYTGIRSGINDAFLISPTYWNGLNSDQKEKMANEFNEITKKFRDNPTFIDYMGVVIMSTQN